MKPVLDVIRWTWKRRAFEVAREVTYIVAILALVVMAISMSRDQQRLDDRYHALAFVADDVQANKTLTNGGRLIETQCNVGILSFQARLDNWNPTCLSSNAHINVQGSDNSGSTITGIDAVDNALPVGSKVTVCNTAGPTDASLLSFTNLDANSAAGNRILAPDVGEGGRCSITTSTQCHLTSECPGGESCTLSTSRVVVPPGQCLTLRLEQPFTNQGGGTTDKAWVADTQTRAVNFVTQALNFYPILFTDSISGTVDDYNPTSTAVSGALHTYSCTPGPFTCGEAGDDLTFMSNSVIAINTTALTTIRGLHYDTQKIGPSALGPVKILWNSGTGNIVLQNHNSAMALDNIETGAGGDRRGDVTLLPGDTVMVWHQRDTGAWQVVSKRDFFYQALVSMTAGLAVTGANSSQTGVLATLVADHTTTGDTTARTGAFVRDNGSYDTTGGSLTEYGMRINQNATRSAGAAGLFNVAEYVSASSASAASNTAIQTDTGNNTLNTGGGYSSATNDLFLKSTFNCSSGVPTVNHGTLDANPRNCVGRVTAVGANTSVVLTYVFTGAAGGAFGTTSFCSVTVEDAGSTNAIHAVATNTGATFSFENSTTGVPANCPNFTYFCGGY